MLEHTETLATSTQTAEFRLGVRSRKRIRLALVGLGLCCLAVRILFFFGAPLSDLQYWAFPFVLVLLWRLCCFEFLGVGAVVFGVAALGGLLSLAHLQGYLPRDYSPEKIYLSRLEGDQHGAEVRAVLKRFNDVARTYGLPSMELLDQGFETREQLEEWRSWTHGVRLAAWGSTEWLRLELPDDVALVPDAKPVASTGELFPSLQDIAIRSEGGVSIIEAADLDIPLAVVTAPRSFAIPLAAPDLAYHFLAWFAQGILAPLPLAATAQARDENLEMRRHAFAMAAQFSGPWASSAPKAAGQFYLGTVDLFRGALRNGVVSGELACGLTAFKKAAHLANDTYDGELVAAVLNNAAVAEFLRAVKPAQFKRVEQWLWRAARMSDDSPETFRGSKAALLNLRALYRAGFLSYP